MQGTVNGDRWDTPILLVKGQVWGSGHLTPQAWLQIDFPPWGIYTEFGGIAKRPTLLVQPC